MADDKSAAKSLAEGALSILDRVGEFFHIFDLSFLVAGTVTVGALLFLYTKTGATQAYFLPDWAVAIAFLIASYTAGLMAFALGRGLNGLTFRRNVFVREFQMSLWAHELRDPAALGYYHTRLQKQAHPDNPEALTDGERREFLIHLRKRFPEFLDQEFIELLIKQPDRLWWLYIRMWQDVAFKRPKSAPFRDLKRYWVMAATYDGLAVSFAAWAGVSILATFPEVAATPIPREWGWALLLGFLLMSIAALRQGANYYRYQIQDLVAAFSAATSPMMPIE